MLDKVLIEYSKKFNDNFPVYIVRDFSEEEIIKLAKKAIETNTPYKPLVEEGVVY